MIKLVHGKENYYFMPFQKLRDSIWPHIHSFSLSVIVSVGNVGVYHTFGVASYLGMCVMLGGMLCLRAGQVAAERARTRVLETQLLILVL